MAKPPTFILSFAARTCHAWLVRQTRARRGGLQGGRRESCLLTFCILRLGDAVQRWLRHPEPSSWSCKSAIKEKVTLCFFAGEQYSPLLSSGSSRRRPLQDITPVYPIDKIADITSIPSTNRPKPRPPCTFSGRADNACTNLLGFFVRCVRTRGIAEISESGKTADFRFTQCRTHLPRMARATNSCTRKVFFKREESPLK